MEAAEAVPGRTTRAGRGRRTLVAGPGRGAGCRGVLDPDRPVRRIGAGGLQVGVDLRHDPDDKPGVARSRRTTRPLRSGRALSDPGRRSSVALLVNRNGAGAGVIHDREAGRKVGPDLDLYEFGDEPLKIRFSADGTRMVIAGPTGRPLLVDVTTGAHIARPLEHPGATVTAFRIGGELVATAGD